jgi:hypothetical protein
MADEADAARTKWKESYPALASGDIDALSSPEALDAMRNILNEGAAKNPDFYKPALDAIDDPNTSGAEKLQNIADALNVRGTKPDGSPMSYLDGNNNRETLLSARQALEFGLFKAGIKTSYDDMYQRKADRLVKDAMAGKPAPDLDAVEKDIVESDGEEEDLLDALYKVKRRRNVDQFGSDYAFPTPKVKNRSLQWLIEDVSKLSLTNETQKKQVVAAAEKSKAWFSGIAVVGTVLGSVGLHFMTKYHNKKVAESELQRLQLAQEPLVDALDRLDKTFETRKAKNESEARKAREKRMSSHQHQQEKSDKVLSKSVVDQPASPKNRETVQGFWEKMRGKYRL